MSSKKRTANNIVLVEPAVKRQRRECNNHLNYISEILYKQYEKSLKLPTEPISQSNINNSQFLSLYSSYNIIFSYLELWDFINIFYISSQSLSSLLLKVAIPNILKSRYNVNNSIFIQNIKDIPNDQLQYLSLRVKKLIFWIKCVFKTETVLIEKELENIYFINCRDIESLWNILNSVQNIFDDSSFLPSSMTTFCEILLKISCNAAVLTNKYIEIESNPLNITCYDSITSFQTMHGAYTKRSKLKQSFNVGFNFKSVENEPNQPMFVCNRFGRSIDFIHDHIDPENDDNDNVLKVIYIGGEHEDSYDPDFFQYNDIFVISTKLNTKYIPSNLVKQIKYFKPLNAMEYSHGYSNDKIPDFIKYADCIEINHYGYNENTFPATDHHSTLIDTKRDWIWIIGGAQRKSGIHKNKVQVTPIKILNLNDLKVTVVAVKGGTSPGIVSKPNVVWKDDEMDCIVLRDDRDHTFYQFDVTKSVWF